MAGFIRVQHVPINYDSVIEGEEVLASRQIAERMYRTMTQARM